MSTAEPSFDQCYAEIAKRMQVCTVAAGFQVIESPASDGSPFKAWPPIFQTRRAAELFLDELVSFDVIGGHEEIYGSATDAEYCVERFEEMARVWRNLEQQGIANPLELARTFCAWWPAWWPRPLH